MMKKRVKKLWLEALRSGAYKQTTGKLTNGKGFCCLGVLCNLHALEKGKEWEKDGNRFYYFGDADTLPPEVIDWAGLDSTNPSVMHENMYYDLAEVNDKKKRFKTIAKLIEKQL